MGAGLFDGTKFLLGPFFSKPQKENLGFLIETCGGGVVTNDLKAHSSNTRVVKVCAAAPSKFELQVINIRSQVIGSRVISPMAPYAEETSRNVNVVIT